MSKIVLVTGGSRGIGREVALLAAGMGYDVAVNYTANADKAAEVVAAVEQAGQRAMVVQADVSQVDQVEAMFAAIDRDLGTLDALINNAGIGKTHARIEDTLPQDLVDTFAVNVFGVFYCSQAAVRRMAIRHGGKGGSIVNVSSAAARTGGVNAFIDYAASKGAVDVITTGLAREAGGDGIRVNAVRPGVTETEMLADADADWLKEVVKTMPMGRIGKAREIAHAIVWLMSDEASYVTGSIIDASGGRAVP
jgi:NAD(P)-dependent dehydrogenase (short-subunit alcohol dehydrogenase family)